MTAAARDERLVCNDLAVTLGERAVLSGLDLEVGDATRLALTGASGSGKTTLLRTVAGLQRAQRGTVRLGPDDLTGRPAHRRGVAVVFQEPRLLPHLSVRDNVALPLRAAGLARAERRRRADEQLVTVGLGGLGPRRIGGLSGGEQQRVALARALSASPRLLLLDEPLAALDPELRGGLRRLITSLQEERQVTMVVVTHDRQEAAELGQRIAFLSGGQIAQAGEPEELFERPRSAEIARFFGGTNLIQTPAGLTMTRPEHVELSAGAGAAADLHGVVAEAVYAGDHVRVIIDCGEHEVVARVPTGAAPAAGERVAVTLPPGRRWLIPDTARA